MIVVAGLDHRTSSLDERAALAAIADAVTPFDETLVLSTCNRHEVYAVTDDPGAVARWTGAPVVALNDAAVEHALRVAAGLESVVLGEPQILTQVRAAFKAARAAETLGPLLTATFQRAINVGKRARTETGITGCAPSLIEAGLAIARDELGSLDGLTTLIVGAGKMGDLAATAIARHDVRIEVANRTPERADALARRIGGATVVDLADGLAHADLIVTSTASPAPVITADMLDRDVFVLDLAVPRDVEPSARARVVDIDELARVITPNGRAADEVAAVERLVAEQLGKYTAWAAARATRAA